MRGTKGITFTRRPTAPAKGYGEGLRKKVSVGFAPDLFERISAMAEKDGVSFGEQVNRLCRMGMPCDGKYP